MTDLVAQTAHVCLRWMKSSHSGQGTNCVELTRKGAAVAIRDSKNPAGPALALSPAVFHRFLTQVKTDTI